MIETQLKVREEIEEQIVSILMQSFPKSKIETIEKVASRLTDMIWVLLGESIYNSSQYYVDIICHESKELLQAHKKAGKKDSYL